MTKYRQECKLIGKVLVNTRTGERFPIITWADAYFASEAIFFARFVIEEAP